MSDNNLLGTIEQKYKSFSKSHKRIADYILEHYDTSAFMTAS